MKLLKNLNLAMLVLLIISVIITLSLGGFMPLFSIALGWLFAYYLVIFVVLVLLNEKKNNMLKYTMALLFFIPIIWGLFAPETLFNFLLQGVKLDFR